MEMLKKLAIKSKSFFSKLDIYSIEKDYYQITKNYWWNNDYYNYPKPKAYNQGRFISHLPTKNHCQKKKKYSKPKYDKNN